MNLLLVVVGWEGGDGARCYGTKADVMTLHLSKHRGGRGGEGRLCVGAVCAHSQVCRFCDLG